MPTRPAIASDVKPLIQLMLQLGYPDTESFITDKLSYLLKHPDYYILAYEDEEGVKGFISLHIMFELGLEGNTAVIHYLVIDENHKGKGIGRLLEEQAVVLAKRRKCTRIQLHCSSHRHEAHQFYLRLNYQEWPKYFSKVLE